MIEQVVVNVMRGKYQQLSSVCGKIINVSFFFFPLYIYIYFVYNSKI